MKGIEVFPTHPDTFYRWLDIADESILKAVNVKHSIMDESFPFEFALAIRCKLVGCYNKDRFGTYCINLKQDLYRDRIGTK